MPISNNKLRSRLETQGFTGFTDAELRTHQLGIRFAYILCASLVLLGLLLNSFIVLTSAMLIALWGTISNKHPFDYVYNGLIRKWADRPPVPLRANQGRFACGIATLWIAGIQICFYVGMNVIAYSLGAALLGVAGLVSATDICIPSIIYNYAFLRNK